MHRFGGTLVLGISLAIACSKPSSKEEANATSAPNHPSQEPVAPPAPPPTPTPTATPTPLPKSYKRVLHTGDSMVGGGLARALRPKFEAEGAKYVRDVWESGSLRDFSRSDRIPKLIKEVGPDLILLSLGANDVYEPKPEVMAPFVAKIAQMTKGVDCVWIGPPIWKEAYKRIVPVLRDNAAPCTFFDSSDIEMHRKPDGIHPDEKGGETYADAFWKIFRPQAAPM